MKCRTSYTVIRKMPLVARPGVRAWMGIAMLAIHDPPALISWPRHSVPLLCRLAALLRVSTVCPRLDVLDVVEGKWHTPCPH
jgi:hypothetical protein